MTQLQLLLFSGLAFFVMLPYLQRTLTITLDTDWIWRKALPAVWARAKRTFGALQAIIGHGAGNANSVALTLIDSHYGIDSRLARTWSIRGMALWVLVLLLGYLMLYYI